MGGEDSPKKGIHGGFARCRLSRYSPKFLVLPISLRICSSTVMVRAGIWSHVRFRRWMGAVPRAEMMDVRVE
jgi:hypothetical protein